MEQGAGEVVSTYPHDHLEIARGRDIIIYSNPDPMPTMTATDHQIAAALEAQNDITTNTDTLAHECRILVEDAGRSASGSTSLPIFVPGSDAEKPALNDLAGLKREHGWVALNARSTTGLTAGWYRDRATPEPGCLLAKKFPATAQCDEFPFWATLQAYGGSLQTQVPSIGWTPGPENNLEGRALGHFISSNAGAPEGWGWDGCGVTKQDPTDTSGTSGSRFLVIPMPYTAPKTQGYCN